MTDPGDVIPIVARELGAPEAPWPIRPTPRALATLGMAAVVLAVAVLALLQSWQRWLDPIIDTGRDLYIPEQLARGAKLYRDLRYQYPPLAPYLLALMPGRSLAAYTALGIGQSLVVAAALWISLRRSVLAAFVATLFFVALSMCGASTWGANFVFPYSYAATIGMMLLVIALAALVHERVAIAFAALLLASWCKVEYAIAVALIVIVVAITRRASLRQIAALAAAWLASLGFVAWYFPAIRENVFSTALTEGATARRFFAAVAGRPGWDHVLAAVGILAVAWSAAALPPLGRWSRRRLGSRTPYLTVAILISLALASHAFFRAWAVLQLVALGYALARDRRSPLALFAVFSFAATLRVPFNISPVWYGFVLIVPTYALIAYVLFVWLPERGVPALVWLPLVALLCGRDLWEQHERWGAKQFPIVTRRGTFYDWNADRARALSEFRPAGTLAVFPEGITINYLTGTTTPLSFHTFTPVETADRAVEDEILREIAAHPPDRVAIVHRDVREYGSRGFGIDYDRRLAAWIFGNYAVERQWPGLIDLRRR